MTQASEWDGHERRHSVRLRALIDQINERIAQLRQDTEMQGAQIAQLRKELERLSSTDERSASAVRHVGA